MDPRRPVKPILSDPFIIPRVKQVNSNIFHGLLRIPIAKLMPHLRLGGYAFSICLKQD